MTRRFLTGLAALATVLMVALGLVAAASAQDTATPTMGGAGHPAHIHMGTCDTLGDIVFPLNDVAPSDAAADADATPSLAMASTPVAGAALQSTTTVDAALDDIIGGGHAVNVHESVENMGLYIACGDITGEASDGMLTVELQELNESGVSGQAMLTDNGDGTTTVEIHLMPGDSTMATPAS